MTTHLTKKNKIIFKADVIEKVDVDLYAFADSEEWHRWRLYDYQKEVIIPGEYDTVWPFYNEVGCVRMKPNDKFNFINREGKFIFPIHFDAIEGTLFTEWAMKAYIGKRCIKIALTGNIDISKRELAKIILEEI